MSTLLLPNSSRMEGSERDLDWRGRGDFGDLKGASLVLIPEREVLPSIGTDMSNKEAIDSNSALRMRGDSSCLERARSDAAPNLEGFVLK